MPDGSFGVCGKLSVVITCDLRAASRHPTGASSSSWGSEPNSLWVEKLTAVSVSDAGISS